MTTQNLLPLTNTFAPADQAAVAEIVRSAFEAKTPVYPIGGGTRIDYGPWPTAPGVGLSLEKLNRLVDYRPDDLTITVEAGMTMAELAKILAERRQQLPIDISSPDIATIGGAVATNAAGPRRFVHGTMRDYVLGFSAVDGQGNIFSGGGKVLKNNAGYNTPRLMTGALGTLGVITQLTLSLRPLPEMSAIAACDLSDLETAEKLLAELMQNPILPVAVELELAATDGDRPVSPRNNPVFDPIAKENIARLYVGVEGAPVEVQWMLDILRDAWQTSAVSSTMIATDSSAVSLHDYLTDYPADVQISVPPSAVTNMIGTLRSLDPTCVIQASAGNGIIKASFLQPKEKFPVFLRNELQPIVSATGGKLIVLKNPANSGLTCRDVWGLRRDGFTIMQSLKDRFDPAGILNPGRYIFDRT